MNLTYDAAVRLLELLEGVQAAVDTLHDCCMVPPGAVDQARAAAEFTRATGAVNDYLKLIKD